MELEKYGSQRIWGWRMAIYLFLVGLGGGCYLIGILFDLLFSGYSTIAQIGVLLGVPIALVGTLFLLTDLGRPDKAVRAILRPSTSWISRGTLILGSFLILGILHIAFFVWPFASLIDGMNLQRVLEAITGFLALLAVIYTGLALATFRPLSFWCNPLLPALFLISGISSALMAIGLGGVFWDLIGYNIESRSIAVLASLNIPVILLEGLLVFFYTQGSHIVEASRSSTHKMIRGNLAVFFWVGFVLIGLVLPFAGSVIVKVSSLGNTESLFVLTTLTAILGLLGGYLLRYLVVVSGVKAPLTVGGVIVLPNPEI